ncbi:hypothetical protein JCM10213_006835 [Rhodosporidiobolus nylandii]
MAQPLTPPASDPFPLLHLADLDFDLAPLTIPTLPSYQLALAHLNPDWDDALAPKVKQAWRKRREKARKDITAKVPMGVFAAEEDKEKEQTPWARFELVDLSFEVKEGGLDELTSAQLAAMVFHPKSTETLVEEASDIFFNRRERDFALDLSPPSLSDAPPAVPAASAAPAVPAASAAPAAPAPAPAPPAPEPSSAPSSRLPLRRAPPPPAPQSTASDESLPFGLPGLPRNKAVDGAAEKKDGADGRGQDDGKSLREREKEAYKREKEREKEERERREREKEREREKSRESDRRDDRRERERSSGSGGKESAGRSRSERERSDRDRDRSRDRRDRSRERDYRSERGRSRSPARGTSSSTRRDSHHSPAPSARHDSHTHSHHSPSSSRYDRERDPRVSRTHDDAASSSTAMSRKRSRAEGGEDRSRATSPARSEASLRSSVRRKTDDADLRRDSSVSHLPTARSSPPPVSSYGPPRDRTRPTTPPPEMPNPGDLIPLSLQDSLTVLFLRHFPGDATEDDVRAFLHSLYPPSSARTAVEPLAIKFLPRQTPQRPIPGAPSTVAIAFAAYETRAEAQTVLALMGSSTGSPKKIWRGMEVLGSFGNDQTKSVWRFSNFPAAFVERYYQNQLAAFAARKSSTAGPPPPPAPPPGLSEANAPLPPRLPIQPAADAGAETASGSSRLPPSLVNRPAPPTPIAIPPNAAAALAPPSASGLASGSSTPTRTDEERQLRVELKLQKEKKARAEREEKERRDAVLLPPQLQQEIKTLRVENLPEDVTLNACRDYFDACDGLIGVSLSPPFPPGVFKQRHVWLAFAAPTHLRENAKHKLFGSRFGGHRMKMWIEKGEERWARQGERHDWAWSEMSKEYRNSHKDEHARCLEAAGFAAPHSPIVSRMDAAPPPPSAAYERDPPSATGRDVNGDVHMQDASRAFPPHMTNAPPAIAPHSPYAPSPAPALGQGYDPLRRPAPVSSYPHPPPQQQPHYHPQQQAAEYSLLQPGLGAAASAAFPPPPQAAYLDSYGSPWKPDGVPSMQPAAYSPVMQQQQTPVSQTPRPAPQTNHAAVPSSPAPAKAAGGLHPARLAMLQQASLEPEGASVTDASDGGNAGEMRLDAAEEKQLVEETQRNAWGARRVASGSVQPLIDAPGSAEMKPTTSSSSSRSSDPPAASSTAAAAATAAFSPPANAPEGPRLLSVKGVARSPSAGSAATFSALLPLSASPTKPLRPGSPSLASRTSALAQLSPPRTAATQLPAVAGAGDAPPATGSAPPLAARLEVPGMGGAAGATGLGISEVKEEVPPKEDDGLTAGQRLKLQEKARHAAEKAKKQQQAAAAANGVNGMNGANGAAAS